MTDALDLAPTDRRFDETFAELRAVMAELDALGPNQPLGNPLLQRLKNALRAQSAAVGGFRTDSLRLSVDRSEALAAIDTALAGGGLSADDQAALEATKTRTEKATRDDIPEKRGPRVDAPAPRGG